MKIYLSNVQGLNSIEKKHTVIGYARKYDISFLVETKLSLRKRQEIRSKWRHREGVFMSGVDGARRGVLTLFSDKLNVRHLEDKADEEGQFCVNVFVWEGENYLIVNYYGDPDLDVNARNTINRLVGVVEGMRNRYQVDHMIVGGDFNFVLFNEDSHSTSRKPQAEARWVTAMQDWNVYDVAQVLHNIPEHTYFRHRHETCSARYDRFYVTRNLLEGVKVKVMKRTGDHAPVLLELKRTKRGSSMWAFDDKILKEAEGIQKIHETIANIMRPLVGEDDIEIGQLQYLIDYQTNCPVQLLTKIVKEIRERMMGETKRRRKKFLEKEEQQLDRMIEARNELRRVHNPENEDVYNRERESLRLLQNARARRAEEINYTQYAVAGERMTSYFFKINSKGKVSREIRKLVVEDEELKGEDVAKYMYAKFADMAKKDEAVGGETIEQFLGEEVVARVQRVKEEDKSKLERVFSEDEVEKVVGKLKKVSAPGPLGISNSLLKMMVPLIKKVLVEAGNKLFFSEEMPEKPAWLFHRKVVFILKPGRNETNEDSYRGLSMLENIFKIYSKIIGDRMAEVLLDIQDKNQYGFTAGKSCMEPTRTIIDTVRYAQNAGKSLVVLSTDIYKAFDCVDFQHMENCLQFYEYPERYREAFMRLVRNGTIQFEVNGHISGDYELEKGTGQGDPKSCFCYNTAVAPLNEFLSRDPLVPRFKVDGVEINPVYFADDNGLLLDGEDMDRIISVLDKIASYERVSGLKLNLTKCEIMAINCSQNEVNNLIARTGMVRVDRMKHLGVIIHESGEAREEDNIRPVVENMNAIADRYSTVGSTPIGRALYATFLLASRYVHRLQNTAISERMLKDMSESTIQMTWTRARFGEEEVGWRVHIAKDRVCQPYRYGGLLLPKPEIRNIAIRLSWIRKFKSCYAYQGWYVVLEKWLREQNRPGIEMHMRLGVKEWRKTAEKLEGTSTFWSGVFSAGEKMQELMIKHEPNWHMIPVMGSSDKGDEVMHNSVEFANPYARPMTRRGLKVIGQLFKTHNTGMIDTSRMKTLEEVREEFEFMHELVWMTIVSIVREIKNKYRVRIMNVQERYTTDTILEAMVGKYKKGCSVVTRMLLKEERSKWPDETPRAYRTYTADGFVVDKYDFMNAFEKVRKTHLTPSIQWTSTQILLRTIWTKVKEMASRRGNADNRCLNCGMAPEHTKHLFYECNLMVNVFEKLATAINEECGLDINITMNMVMFHAYDLDITEGQRQDIDDLLMIVKHCVYRARFRENVARYRDHLYEIKVVIIIIVT